MQEDDGRLSQGFGADGGELKEELSQKAHQAAEQARSVAERGKQKLAESAEGVTTALRHASEGLRSDEQTELARYTGVVADKLERLTSTLKTRDVQSLLSEVTRFAKRQPALFLGGAFTTGLIAARFLKSSAAESNGSASQSAFDRAPVGGGTSSAGLGDPQSESSSREDLAAGFGPAPGGYGPASAPAGAHGGDGIFGADGAGGGPGNDPSIPEKGAAE